MTWTYAFDEPPALDRAALKALLGGKGANLAVMANELALPVPPGFVITTEACKAFGRAGWPSRAGCRAAGADGAHRRAGRPGLR